MNDNAAQTKDDPVSYLGDLSSDLAALVVSGDMDAEEAADMLEWLGLPHGE
jgi:hypothetical protein